jgi:hypothetical protein
MCECSWVHQSFKQHAFDCFEIKSMLNKMYYLKIQLWCTAIVFLMWLKNVTSKHSYAIHTDSLEVELTKW